MNDFILLCKAIAGSTTGARIRRRNNKKGKSYSFFSSNLFSQILAGLVISVVFGLEFLQNAEVFVGSDPTYLKELFTNTITSYFLALFGLCLLNVLNIFFLSKNDQSIVSFPIAPGKIYLARMVLSLGYAVLYSFLVLTVGIIYLAYTGGSPLMYVAVIVTFLTLPFIFIAISFIIVNTVGSIVNFKKHRTLGIAISIFIAIIAFAAFYLPTIFQNGDTVQEMIASLRNMNQIYAQFNWISYIPMKAILLRESSDWIYLLLQVAIAVVAVGLSYLYANATYINNIGLEEGKKKKKISADKTERKLNKAFSRIDSNGMKSYIHRSVKEVLHAPQIAMIYVFTPIFVALVIGTSFTFLIPYIFESLPAQSPNLISTEIVILVAFCVISTMVYSGSSIAVSSENKNIALLKSSPIDPKQYLDSRIFLSVMINLVMGVIVSLVFVLANGISPIFILYILLELLPATILFNYINVWCDLIIPRFNWNNIAEITNNSWKPFFNLIVNFISWLAMSAISIVFILVPNGLAFIGPVTVGLIFSALAILYRHLAAKKFMKMMSRDINY